MTPFLRYPSTPYLEAPDGIIVRSDKVLDAPECDALLAAELAVEEKVDGENLGLSVVSGQVRAQARGNYVELGGRHFRGLASWLGPRNERLRNALGAELTLFGEWCADAHSVPYDQLPDWLLIFDVYDSATGLFWSSWRRDAFVEELGLALVPRLATGRFGLDELHAMMGRSRLGSRPMEGLVVRAQDDDDVWRRAKLVRPGFKQAINEHWASRARIPNRLAVPA